MADVFISYVREDRPTAELLAHAFEREDLTVWWDRELVAGDAYDTVIERELKAARCVVALWTKNSVDSRWVRSEASEGDRRGILVPAVMGGVAAPLAFSLLHAADLSGFEGSTSHPGYRDLRRGVRDKLQGDRKSVAGAEVVETSVDFGSLTVGQVSPRRRVRIEGDLGFLDVAAADPWIKVDEVTEGVVLSVDTSSAGHRSGVVRVRAGQTEIRIAVTAVVAEKGGKPPLLLLGAGGAVLLLLILLGARAFSSGDSGSDSESGRTSLAVAAADEWTDTGVDVSPGHSLSIAATGEADTATEMAGRTSDPSGILGEENHPNNVIQGVRHAALIAKVGDEPPFVVGAYYQGSVTAEGRLYLGLNDRGFENNGGQYDVTITVR